MPIWAISDLHLSFGVPNKKMDVFGEQWVKHTQKIQSHWLAAIHPNDLVLIPGDISWAMTLEEVKPDLEWIHYLPGTKVIIRGNHDFWWSSLSKIEKILPPSIHLIQNNAFDWGEVTIGGARLWDTPEYKFDEFIHFMENRRAKLTEIDTDNVQAEVIFTRELGRLELSLKALNPKAKMRIAMTHYPPIGPELLSSRASLLLEKYQVNICVFGHLHNVRPNLLFGEKHHIRYYLTSCDYLNFKPICVTA